MICYSFVSTDFYNELKEKKIIYPKLGISCSASWDDAYKAFEKRYGFLPFFAWSKEPNYDGYQELARGERCYMLTLDLPDDSYLLTNYLNWCDMINLYENRDCQAVEDNYDDILIRIGLSVKYGLDELWKDVFVIDENDMNQIMYKYLDISFVKEAKLSNYSIKTY